jgi:hypothetical protein
MKSILLATALLLSLNSNAFDASSIEGFFNDVKNTSVQFYKDNEEEIDEITSKTAELYEIGKEKTTKFISDQESRYQEYQAKQLDIKLLFNKFHTSEGKVPAGCFFNLAVKDNGDDLVRSVYLNKGYLRGCIDANRVYPGKKDGYTFDYKIIKNTAIHEYDIQACMNYDDKYSDCDKFSIRFKNFDYRIDGVVKQVLGVEKIGNL